MPRSYDLGEYRRRIELKDIAPAILFLYVLDAVILSVPVSLILIWLYRRTVERAMRATSSAGEIPPPLPVASPPREPWNPLELRNREQRLRLRLALVYAVAGAFAAAVWTWLYFQTPGLEFAGLRGFAVWYVFCWPVTATFITLVAISWRRSLSFVAAYIAAGMLVIAAWSAFPQFVSSQSGIRAMANLRSFLFLLALEATLPALIILIASNRRIRGVSPLALAALLVFTFSSVAAREIFVTLLDVGDLRNPLLTIGPNGWFMLATVPVGYLCWRLLVFLNAGYRRKSFSDVQLVADLFWVIVAFVFSAQYASGVGWKGAAGLAGFVAYRGIAQLGLAVWRPPNEPGMRLLILRVFGFRARTEKLFDAVAQRWRFRGGVAMIAGTDLAARTIDPDDTLAFLTGNFDSRFIQGPHDREEHLRLMDESRDPDGRFRVTEFFCHENTWSSTLAALLGRSDAILMDLRGFSEKNNGCIFELHQLMAQQRLADTVFVVDASTDVKLLESTVGTAGWGTVTHSRLRLERVESETASEREQVYRSLCLESGSTPT